MADGVTEGGHVAGRHEEAGAVQDLGDHGDPRGDDGAAEGHGVEELGRCLAARVAGVALGHGHHVGGGEVAGHVVERDPAHEADAGIAARQGATGGARGIGPDESEGHVAASETRHRGAEVLDALVRARRAEEHDDALPRHAEPAPRLERIDAAGRPGIGVSHVGNQRAAESPLEKAGGHGDAVGDPSEALRQPGPRQSGGVGEVQRAPYRAEDARAQEEADLPVVDIEQQRAVRAEALDIADPGARQPGLGGVEQIAVGQSQEGRQRRCEARKLRARHGPARDSPGGHGLPHRLAVARPHDLDLAERLEQASEEEGAPGAVTGQIEAEDRHLHAADLSPPIRPA